MLAYLASFGTVAAGFVVMPRGGSSAQALIVVVSSQSLAAYSPPPSIKVLLTVMADRRAAERAEGQLQRYPVVPGGDTYGMGVVPHIVQGENEATSI